jgi:hypothetical protein
MGSSEATEERHRIARDLHDVLGHNLSVMSVEAAVAIRAIEREDSPAIDALRAIKAMSDDTLTGLRSGTSSADVEILFETMSIPPTTEWASSLRGMIPSLRLPIDRSHTFGVAGPWE